MTMNLNKIYLDPPRYGWTAIGGIADILEPHEAARRGIFIQKTKKNATAAEGHDGATGDGQAVQSDGDAVKGENTSEETTELYYTIIQEAPEKMETKEEKSNSNNENSNSNSDEKTDTAEEMKETKARSSRRKSKSKNKDEEDAKPKDTKPDIKEDTKAETVKVTNEEGKEEPQQPTEPKPKQITIQSTKNGVLDIYTYHRGRVGQEPRDDKGELLAPLDAIDTNHDWRPNGTLVKVLLDFPLDDDDDYDFDIAEEDKQKSRYRFKDTIIWDLSSPTTPEEYATTIATNYHLSFRTTMEIIESISKQVQDHLLQSSRYYPPIVIKDAYGNDRPDRQFPIAEDVFECFGRTEDVISRGDGGRGNVVATTISRGQGRRKKEKKERSARPMGAVKPQRGVIEVVPQSKVPKANSDNDPYAAEVLRRAKLESQQIASECKARGDEVLWHAKNEVCHICHNRKPLVLTFHCGSHSYCDYHCATRLSFRAQDYDPSNPQHPIDHCPVCTLQCTCSKCVRRLETVKDKLKSKSDEQGCIPEDVVMPNILGLCSAKLTSVPKNRVERKITPHGGGLSRGAGASSRKSDISKIGGDKKRSRSRGGEDIEGHSSDRPAKKMRRMSSGILPVGTVLKVNPLEFPKELYEGKDVDPSESGDYERCFVPAGSVITNREKEEKYQDIIPMPCLAASHIDACIVCNEGGEITGCIKCPRVYHAECAAKERGHAEVGNMCHRCNIDRQLSPEEDEELSQSPTNPLIKERYGKDAFEEKLMELIVAIINKLKVYDFGFVFSNPVDADNVPGYSDIIKHPMDYGTVIKKLEGGLYPNEGFQFTKKMSETEEIILHTICDVEQVHHNCMVFNQKGSAFWGYGYVHSVKWKSFYKKHIAERLSPNVKVNLEEVRTKRKKEQNIQGRALSVAKPNNRNVNPVGVYDPSTKRVIKVYSSKASALRAAELLKSAGYACEYSIDFNSSSGKTLMDKLTNTASTYVLFGYRWIPMDRLRSGQFKLKESEESSNIIADNIVVWTVDTVTGCKLQGFESEDAAYNNWLKSRSTAISIDPSIGEDLSSFQQHFLNGVNTINGVAWNLADTTTHHDTIAEKQSIDQDDAIPKEEESSVPWPPSDTATGAAEE